MDNFANLNEALGALIRERDAAQKGLAALQETLRDRNNRCCLCGEELVNCGVYTGTAMGNAVCRRCGVKPYWPEGR